MSSPRVGFVPTLRIVAFATMTRSQGMEDAASHDKAGLARFVSPLPRTEPEAGFGELLE
jgi:hypothetical protein